MGKNDQPSDEIAFEDVVDHETNCAACGVNPRVDNSRHCASCHEALRDDGGDRLSEGGNHPKPPITDCCGAPVKLAFYGKLICSECRSEWGNGGFGGSSV